MTPSAPDTDSARKTAPLWGTLLALAGAAGLLAALAWPVLRWWRWEWTRPDSYYGHAMFVPVLIAVMLWARRGELRAIPMRTAPAALALLVPALALLVVSVKTEMQAVMSWALLLTVTGSVWYVCGARMLRAAAFPLGFLWLMAPLPGPLLNDATLGLQQTSTVGAALLLKLMGFGGVRDGNLIHLDGFTLHVDVPCSGFKLLLSLLTLSAGFAYLTDMTRGRKWALFLLSLPLSVVINTVRIALVGVIGACIGASTAERLHDASGMVALVLCMAVLFGIARALGCRRFAGLPLF